MLKKQIILKSSAAFLMVLISLATTPKLLLHHIFANHKDSSFQLNKDRDAKITNAGINCHAQDLVVEAPFIHHAVDEISSPAVRFQTPAREAVPFLFSLTEFYFKLRGPPAII